MRPKHRQHSLDEKVETLERTGTRHSAASQKSVRLSSVGTAALQIAKAAGARVIAVASSDEKLAAARAHGAAVCNMPGSNSQAVAEATLMLMLAALRRAV